MIPDALAEDIPRVLGTARVPPVLHALLEADAAFAEMAWSASREWLDAAFLEEAAVLAGAALEEIADEMPPSPDHVRLGALGGADLPPLDRALEGIIQCTPRTLLLATAWHRAATEEGFGHADRVGTHALEPGPARFLADLPRPPHDAPDLAARAAESIGLASAAPALVALTPWPDYLEVATSDLAGHVGRDPHRLAVERIARQAHEMADSLCPPLPTLAGYQGDGLPVLAELANDGPALLVAAAYLRLGIPAVAHIPRVA